MPRAPKPADQRRRRNLPLHEWVVLHERRKGKPPELPGDDWTTATKKWWREIWRSKVATQWQPEDISQLIELALLRQHMLGGDLKLAPEVSKRADKFGLTPRGRRDLRWIITEEDAARASLPEVKDEIAERRTTRRKRLTKTG